MTDSVRERVVAALRLVFDPEIPVNIYDMGLIYEVEIDEDGAVAIVMTLTSPMCPVAEMLPSQVEERVLAVVDATSVNVEIVWDPPWDPEMMSEAAKLELGLT